MYDMFSTTASISEQLRGLKYRWVSEVFHTHIHIHTRIHTRYDIVSQQIKKICHKLGHDSSFIFWVVKAIYGANIDLTCGLESEIALCLDIRWLYISAHNSSTIWVYCIFWKHGRNLQTSGTFIKGIKNSSPCIMEIRGTQGCALVGGSQGTTYVSGRYLIDLDLCINYQ